MSESGESTINRDELKGGEFLHKKNSNLQRSHFVQYTVETRNRMGSEVSQKPSEKIIAWLKVLEKTHTGHRDEPKVMERIKDYYHKQYVIKPENVPDSYFDTQRRLYRERGYGQLEITEDIKRQNIDILVRDQEASFDRWIDYLTCPDADVYPFWAKYWAFDGVSKLSSFDKEQNKFKKRDEKTVAMFPDLNQEALAKAVDLVVKKVRGESVLGDEDSSQFKTMVGNANFGEYYALALMDLQRTVENREPLSVVEGKWVKYDKGSDHLPLVRSLEGHNTGWCTAGESTAKIQLQSGDFYVYYSNDHEGNPTVPRAAIRMENSNIGEIRGVAKDQNLDPYIGQIVEEKLQEFPDRDKYLKKVKDMERLTEIDSRTKKGETLTDGDLRFIYEIDDKILGFGYQKDPRIQEILSKRVIKKDLAKIYNLDENKISTTENEVMRGGIVFHYGDLYLSSLTTAEGLKLPETMSGDLYLSSLTTAEGLKLPETMSGDLYLSSLTTAEGLKLPETMSGDLYLSSLTTAEGLKLPETMSGDL
ncbi:MAG TPA: hypothetical protein PLI45_05115, partial [Candidatus Woesebacteria bacterium]|nr:hypothetical protein [Candidatus Woesebacteria bacterium]